MIRLTQKVLDNGVETETTNSTSQVAAVMDFLSTQSMEYLCQIFEEAIIYSHQDALQSASK